MALFKYEALDSSGNTVRGTLDAGTPAEARSSLRERGLHAKSLADAIASSTIAKINAKQQGSSWSGFSGRRLDLLSEFSRHLSMLLKTGLPLTQALSVLSEQVEDVRFRNVLQDVAIRVREGASLDESLSCHPKYFPELAVCVARAGAAAGSLPHVLSELSTYYLRQKRLRDKVVSALTYPALMSSIGILVLTFLMAFVVPKVTAVLLEQQHALPWPTEVLLFISTFIQNWWPALILTVVGLAVLGNAIIKTNSGRRMLDGMLLKLPVLGNLFKKQAVARWADTMSNLIFSGIPVAQALAVVRNAVGNKVLEDEIILLEKAVLEGRDLSDAIKQGSALPKSIGFVVGVGEESGELARVLKDVAAGYNEEVEVVSGRLTDLINPILIVFLGLVVGFIVAAILLPITDFSQVQ